MSWFGCLLLFTMMASYSADEPANWEFACGKLFRLQYNLIKEGFQPFNRMENNSDKHDVQISMNDTDLVLNQYRVYSPLCYKYDEGEDSIAGCGDLKINHTFEWNIMINEKEILESKLRFGRNAHYIASRDTYNVEYYLEIGDSFKDNFNSLCKMSLIGRKSWDTIGKIDIRLTESWLFEIPLMSTTINITGYITGVDGHFNNGTGSFHFHVEVDFDNALLDNLNGNERISTIRDNVIKAINWGRDVPVSKKKNDIIFHWKTEKVNLFTNITFADFETRDTEKWFLLKAESIQWPQINFELNALHMTLNETYWGVGFGKSRWNQASWTYSEGNNIAVSTQFNSDFSISSADFKLNFRNSTINIALKFLESQWNLELRKSEHPLRELFAIITRTDLWTQQRRPFTVLQITDIDLEFPEGPDQSSKLVISNLQNFKSIFKNIRGFLRELQVTDLINSIIENPLLRKLFELISTFLLDRNLDEDVMKKIDHLESHVKNAVTFVVKNFQYFVQDENIHIKELFIRSLRSNGGDYVETYDKIIVKYNNLLIKRLPILIYKELSANQCGNTPK